MYIYLASPYSHPDPLEMEVRYRAVMKVTANYLRRNLHVYSPIVHCHEIAKHHSLPRNFAFWKQYNEAMLIEASSLHVLQLEHWDISKGVKAEMAFASRHSIPTTLIPYRGIV